MVIGLPFLHAMGPGGATAQPPTFPKRLIIMFSPNGSIMSDWASGSGTGFTLGRILAPLAEHRESLLLVQGVHSTATQQSGNGHNSTTPHMLTARNFLDPRNDGFGAYGPAGGPSVDQVIASRIGDLTRFPSLEVGVRSGPNESTRMSWRAARESVPREDDPARLFARVFSEVGADAAAREEAALRARRRGSVLDFVGVRLRALQSRVGAEDQRRLESHLEHVRELERQLSFEPSVASACVAPTAPPDVGDVNANDNFPRVGSLQMDLIATALACDLTRTVTLQWSAAGGGPVHTWLGQTQGHHGMSHDYGDSQVNYSVERLIQINTWYAEQLASLVRRLKALPEGDGTVFDNTVILWVSEISNGSNHDRRNIPYVFVGSAGRALDTGRLVRVSGDRMNGDLLVTLMNALGIDEPTFGAPEYFQGPIDTLMA